MKNLLYLCFFFVLVLTSCATRKNTLSFSHTKKLQHAGQHYQKPDTQAPDKTTETGLAQNNIQALPADSTLEVSIKTDDGITASSSDNFQLLPNEALSVFSNPGYLHQDTTYVREPKVKSSQDDPYNYAANQQYNILAIVSLACGVLGLLFLFTTLFPFFMGTAAVVTGILGLRQIRKTPTRWKGKGFAIAGLITGILTIILFWVMVSLLVLLLLTWGA